MNAAGSVPRPLHVVNPEVLAELARGCDDLEPLGDMPLVPPPDEMR